MWAGEKKTKKKLEGDAACRRRREAVRGDTKKKMEISGAPHRKTRRGVAGRWYTGGARRAQYGARSVKSWLQELEKLNKKRNIGRRSEKIGCCAARRRRTQNDVGDSRNATNRIKKKTRALLRTAQTKAKAAHSAPKTDVGERQNKTVVGVMAGHRKNDLKNEEMPRMVARPRKIKSNNLRRRCTRQALGDVKIAVRGRQKGSARILNEVWSII
ncbi:hypothetical protein C8J57DRAFT_1457978 [Mycena rebaudengoi]|nr:hypothetical protein C8J57DRAFT_1457978 [Mycena rebaudengoi]